MDDYEFRSQVMDQIKILREDIARLRARIGALEQKYEDDHMPSVEDK